MKKFFASIIVTLAFVATVQAQTSYNTFTENSCNVWVESWAGYDTPGTEYVAATMHGNDILDLLFIDTHFVFTSTVCAPVTIDVRDIWLSVDPANDVDFTRPFTYDPAVLEADGCFDAGDILVVNQSRRFREVWAVEEASIIMDTDAPGDFVVNEVSIRSKDAILDGCAH